MRKWHVQGVLSGIGRVSVSCDAESSDAAKVAIEEASSSKFDGPVSVAVDAGGVMVDNVDIETFAAMFAEPEPVAEEHVGVPEPENVAEETVEDKPKRRRTRTSR